MHDQLRDDPDYQQERTEPFPWLEPAWRAFHELAGERAWASEGMIAGLSGGLILSRPLALPWTAVAAWFAHHETPHDAGVDWIACVLAMDRAYVANQAQRMRQTLRNAVKG